MITKELLDQVQSLYEAGSLLTNTVNIYYNDYIIGSENNYEHFYQIAEMAASAMEKNVDDIITRMKISSNFQEVLSIFIEEFGSRIIILPRSSVENAN